MFCANSVRSCAVSTFATITSSCLQPLSLLARHTWSKPTRTALSSPNPRCAASPRATQCPILLPWRVWWAWWRARLPWWCLRVWSWAGSMPSSPAMSSWNCHSLWHLNSSLCCSRVLELKILMSDGSRVCLGTSWPCSVCSLYTTSSSAAITVRLPKFTCPIDSILIQDSGQSGHAADGSGPDGCQPYGRTGSWQGLPEWSREPRGARASLPSRWRWGQITVKCSIDLYIDHACS